MSSGTRRLTTGALAAGATSPNLLGNDTLRYPGEPSSLEVAAACAVAGAGTQTLLVQVGNQTVFTGLVPVENRGTTDPGEGPSIPNNTLVRTGVAGGDQVSVEVTNAAGVAVATQVLVDIQPA